MSSQNTQSVYIVQDEGICGGQPLLTLAQVHAAISYYYDHQADIDRSIREDRAFAEQLRAELR